MYSCNESWFGACDVLQTKAQATMTEVQASCHSAATIWQVCHQFAVGFFIMHVWTWTCLGRGDLRDGRDPERNAQIAALKKSFYSPTESTDGEASTPEFEKARRDVSLLGVFFRLLWIWGSCND